LLDLNQSTLVLFTVYYSNDPRIWFVSIPRPEKRFFHRHFYSVDDCSCHQVAD